MLNEESRLWRFAVVLGLVAGINEDIGRLADALTATAKLALANPAESLVLALLSICMGWALRR